MSQAIQTEDHQQPIVSTPSVEETGQGASHHELNANVSSIDEGKLSSIPVKLRFEIGEIQVPFGQLQSIGSGVVFALEKPLDQNLITVYANDVAVAIGELVCIDDLVGVQIQRILPTVENLELPKSTGTP